MNNFDQNKTKLLIIGEENKTEATKLLLFIINYLGKEIDFQTSFGSQNHHSDFLLFEGENEQLSTYLPNIVLVTKSDINENYSSLLQNIVSGGVLLYNESDENLKQLLHDVSIFYRKLPFSTPNFQPNGASIILETDLGEIPLPISSDSNFDYISGVKLLCQQLGIMEEEFFEALLNYSF